MASAPYVATADINSLSTVCVDPDVICRAPRTSRLGPTAVNPTPATMPTSKGRKGKRGRKTKTVDATQIEPDYEESCSSASYNATSKWVERRKRRKVQLVKSSMDVDPCEVNRQAIVGAPERVPIIQTFEELLDDHPHLRETANITAMDDKDCSSTTKRGAQGVHRPGHSNLPPETCNPPLNAAFVKAVMNMPLPQFVLETRKNYTTERIHAHLTSRRALLPVLSASFESLLLAEAGRFPVTDANGHTRYLDYPPCARGSACVGIVYRLHEFPANHPGVILTSLMFPEEYEAFLESNVAPSGKRFCILCYRSCLQDWGVVAAA